MTAYLQPGDKIHIAVPGDFGSHKKGQELIDRAVAAYRRMGVEVFEVTQLIHSGPIIVVSVIRPIDPLKAPLMHEARQDPGETKEPLRAHWSAHPEMVFYEGPSAVYPDQ